MTTGTEKASGSDLTDEKYWDMLNRKSVSHVLFVGCAERSATARI